MNRSLMLVVLLGNALVQAASVDPVVTTGIVSAPVNEVWKAVTTKEGIESWMVAKTEFELRVGATWKTSYSKDSTLDDDAAIHHTILAYDPGRMFSFRTVKYPKGFAFPNAIAKTWTVIYLEPVGERQTRFTGRMLGFTDDEESQKMRAFFERGNQQTLDSLIKRFESH
ncbi:MAG: SRPBCC domain-containing protein [Acidobacteriia bacterium]|nr:SRPBCC domain-containing protein [Terriglobia bacterium]